MVLGDVSLLLFVPVEHRELGHPQEIVRIFGNEPAYPCEFKTQRAEGREHYVVGIGTEEDYIAHFALRAFHDLRGQLVAEEFDYGRLQSVFFDCNPRKSLRLVCLDERKQRVDVLSRKYGLVAAFIEAFCVDHAHAAAALDRAGEHLESAAFDEVGNILELEPETRVGFVRAEALHGLFIRHSSDLFRQLDALGFLEHAAHHTFRKRHDVFLIGDEGHFKVYLREFGLSVRAEILVSEALGDLVILVHAAYHEDLFIQLRRLRQRVKLAFMHAGRYEIVSRALGRGTAQKRRFYLYETVFVHIVACGMAHLAAQHENFLQSRRAQFEISVFEAGRVIDRSGFVHLERRVLRLGQYAQLFGEQFHAARFDLGIDSVGVALSQRAAHCEHVLAAYGFGFRKALFAHLREVEHDLQYAASVAEIDENKSAVVTPAVRPSRHGDFLAEHVLGDFGAVRGPFETAH